MARVFVLGMYLPEFQASARMTAANCRTEQIVDPIVAAGHKVRLCASTYFSSLGNRRYTRLRASSQLEYYEMNYLQSDQRDELLRLADDFKPDCIVAVSQHPSHLAASLSLKLPLWCDLYGAVMPEGQAKAFVYKDNDFLGGFWACERLVLERADMFSTCSTFQEHFLVGELAVLGRLGRESFGYQFARTIPPGIPGKSLKAPRGRVLRGKLVGDDDFVILWAGGYNTWTDIDTLFAALEEVFKRDKSARFVSFGGCIDRHDDVTYARFCRMVEGSRFKDRYVLSGWRSRNDVLRAYREADIGINIDKYHYELVFGTRTRLVEMIAWGLPVLTTVGCELSYLIRDNGLGLTFEIGDPAGMARALLDYAGALPTSREHYSERALSHFREHYSYHSTCEPLLKWLGKPCRAPDHDVAKRPVLVVDAAARQAELGVDKGLLALAMQKLSNNDDEAAMKLLDAFVTLRPDHAHAHYHLGSVLKRLGRIDGALDAFKVAESLARRSPDGTGSGILGGIHFHLGECQLALNEKRLAVRHFKRCLALIPNHGKATRYLRKLGD